MRRCMRLYQPHRTCPRRMERWPSIWSSSSLPRIYIDTGRDEPPHVRPACWKAIHRPVEAHRQHGHHRLWQCADGQPVRGACAISVNGVSPASRRHTQRHSCFRIYCKLDPDKFIDITNGITHRRWLMMSQPRLWRLCLTRRIGDGCTRTRSKSCSELDAICSDDAAFLEQFEEVKQIKQDATSPSWHAHTQRHRDRSRFDIRRSGQAPARVQAPAAQRPAHI